MPPTLQVDSGISLFLISFDKEVHVQTGNESISPIHLSLRNRVLWFKEVFFLLFGMVSGCLDVADGDWMTVMFFHCSPRVRLDD